MESATVHAVARIAKSLSGNPGRTAQHLAAMESGTLQATFTRLYTGAHHVRSFATPLLNPHPMYFKIHIV